MSLLLDIILIISLLFFLFVAKKGFDSSDEAGDAYSKALKKAISLKAKQNDALKSSNRTARFLIRIKEEIILEGEKKHLVKANDLYENIHNENEKTNKKIAKQVAAAEKEVRKTKYKYDQAMNRVGKLWAINTLLMVLLLWWIANYLFTVVGLVNSTDQTLIANFGQHIDTKFYEVSSQMILALIIALFISKEEKETINKPKWWGFSKYAAGVTFALTGLALCLYVVGGGASNIFIFFLTMVTIIALIYIALKPLLGKQLITKENNLQK